MDQYRGQGPTWPLLVDGGQRVAEGPEPVVAVIFGKMLAILFRGAMLEGLGKVKTPRSRAGFSPPRLDLRECNLPWAHLSIHVAAQPIKGLDGDFAAGAVF